MRIQGRTLRPSNLAERRLLLSSLGTQALRVPRTANPYLLARRIERAAKGNNPDVIFVRDALNHVSSRTRTPKGLQGQEETGDGSTPDRA